MIERLRGAGIQVNDNIEEGRFVLESFSKKSAVSERNGEVAGNSSSDSLLSSRKDHLSRHPLPNSKDGANLQRNTEIAKIIFLFSLVTSDFLRTFAALAKEMTAC